MTPDVTLLTFILDQVLYAIEIDELQEVVALPQLTPLADGPAFVGGVFNLRGHMVAAIDLRRRLGLPSRQWDVKNAVLIVSAREKLYGLIVDEASALITLSSSGVEPAPDFSPSARSPEETFVRAVAKWSGRLIPILNLNRILTVTDSRKLSDWQANEHHD